MEFHEHELKRQLAHDPLKRHGFTDELRQSIEQRLEANERDSRQSTRRRKFWLFGTGAAFAAMAVYLLIDAGSLLWHGNKLETLTVSHSADPSLRADYESAVHSALLIGLRSDLQAADGETSTYRTLLIAPDQSKLRRFAEGSGIIMPYKTDFWRLVEEKTSEAQGEARQFKAVLAADAEKSGLTSTAISQNREVKSWRIREKLLFVGNRYIALEQAAAPSSGDSTDAEYVWVKELPQLAAARPAAAFSLEEPHVRLTELLGESASATLSSLKAVQPPLLKDRKGGQNPIPLQSDARGESWTISRKPGQWVPQLADYKTDSAPSGRSETAAVRKQDYRLVDIPLTLPESVVSYDKLSLSWQEIKQVQPSAIDAFSSPNRDMVLIVTEGSLIVYPMAGQLMPSPLLTLDRRPNETVIMAHWATEPYIDSWKKNVSQYLK